MSLTLLLPTVGDSALEERFAASQSSSRLVDSTSSRSRTVVRCSADESAAVAAAAIRTEYVLVVTDPFIVTEASLLSRLERGLIESGADAAVPFSNETSEPGQFSPPCCAYLTLREFEHAAREHSGESRVLTWTSGDPGIALTRNTSLLQSTVSLREFCTGKRVCVEGASYVHRWVALRAQDRTDLFALVRGHRESVLDLGCGEGVLGSQVKSAWGSRVVGVELEPAAAAIAATRLDRVVEGDAEEALPGLGETFDLILAGDFIEHLVDPWRLLANLRNIARPDCQLVIATPNAGHGAIVSDLLEGRFDYLYIGLTCVGHLRFYTRSSLRTMLETTGWQVESLDPAPEIRTWGAETLASAMRAAGREPDPDFFVPGFYVVCKPSNHDGEDLNPGSAP